MSENKPDTGTGWSDPDDAPEFTDAMFDAAELTIAGKVVRRGAWRAAGTGEARSRSVPRAKVEGVYAMADKKTSPKAAKAASKTLRDDRTAKASKTAAGSALSQKEGGKKPKK
jgi:hypothetical protein